MKTWVWIWPVLKWSNNSPRLLSDDQIASTAWKCGKLTFSFQFLFSFSRCWLVWLGTERDQNITGENLSYKIRKLTTKGLTGAVRSAMTAFSPNTPPNCLFLPLHLCDMLYSRCTCSREQRVPKKVSQHFELASFTCYWRKWGAKCPKNPLAFSLWCVVNAVWNNTAPNSHKELLWT